MYNNEWQAVLGEVFEECNGAEKFDVQKYTLLHCKNSSVLHLVDSDNVAICDDDIYYFDEPGMGPNSHRKIGSDKAMFTWRANSICQNCQDELPDFAFPKCLSEEVCKHIL